MKSVTRWSSAAVMAIILVSGFQNCSPVSFKEVPTELASQKSDTTGPVVPMCEVENKKEGETWIAAGGQSRELVACTVGLGNQFNVYNISNEYQCTNGSAVLINTTKSPAGTEGLCNLNCGTHKDGETWWNDLGVSSETLQCATSTTATSTVRYQNQAEYLCKTAAASATGKTSKTKLDETACPALAFNDQDNQATLAFEDIYPKPLDSDYNDFVTNIKVVETYSSLGELNKIVIEYAAKSIGGGLPHKLVSIFDGTVRGRDGWVSNQNFYKSEAMFQGDASIKYELFTGGTLTNSATVQKNADLIVFDSTSAAAKSGMVARITVTGIDGKQNLLSVRKGVSIKRYRTLLYVPDSQNYSTVKRYDIDISDINPSAYDDSGRPLAFFVPVNWRAPIEGKDIKNAYPDFQSHSDYLKNSIANPSLVEADSAKNWFNNAVLKYVQ
jgi:hypothetical protein